MIRQAWRSLAKSSAVLRRIVPRAYGNPGASEFPNRSVGIVDLLCEGLPASRIG